MRKGDGFKLDVLSQIADDIIERNTVKRAYLLNKRRKKKNFVPWIALGGVAASILLIFAGVWLWQMLGRENAPTAQVPIYQGMTVSDSIATASVCDPVSAPQALRRGNVDQDAPFGDANGLENAAKEVLDTVGPSRADYYARPNSTVYITVHLYNPDEFEIVSLRLNGVKYTNYMFENGSDLENLILKVELGAEEGVLEYTVDSIKYIDGTKITDTGDKEEEKDVLMRGDPTVTIGVCSEETVAQATVSSQAADFDTLGVALRVDDPSGLIAESAGALYAVLYDGNEIIKSAPLTVGDNLVLFEGLTFGTLYQYAVVATYDAMDGAGYAMHVLYKNAFYTRTPLELTLLDVSETNVSFAAVWADGFESPTLTSLSLFLDGEQVGTLATDTTTLTGLLPQRAYTLRATYLYRGVEYTATLDFTTGKMYCTVTHYKETLYGTWERAESERVEVKIGEIVAPAVKAYFGFVSPTVQSETGSQSLTEINYYYTRIRSTATFVTNGGDPIASGVYMYGEALPKATRDGYAFGGWTLVGGGTSVVTEMGASDQTYYAKWDGATDESYFVYEVVDGSVTITGHNLPTGGSVEKLIIPDYIAGYPVTKIGRYSFEYAKIQTLVLGKYVAEIGKNAFYNCSMGSVSFGEVDVTIGENAFAYNGLGKIDFGSGAVSIGPRAFSGCLFRTLVIPETVVSVDASAFERCENLWEVYNLSGLEFPIEAYEIHTSLDEPSVIVKNEDGWTFIERENDLSILVSSGELDDPTHLILPASTPSGYQYYVADRTFYGGFNDVTHVTIPEGVIGLGHEVFDIPTVTHVEIGKDVAFIGYDCFVGHDPIIVFVDPTGWYETEMYPWDNEFKGWLDPIDFSDPEENGAIMWGIVSCGKPTGYPYSFDEE
ncbi:MAG: leucine-rich repeat protein [Clostridia bacterium]|nr:leucine-rich repeat protein [Clostridia bacterium]